MSRHTIILRVACERARQGCWIAGEMVVRSSYTEKTRNR